MRKYIWQFSVDLPGGKFAVVAAEVPKEETDIYDEFGAPKRKFWTTKRLFKKKHNADKFLKRVYEQQRNFNLSEKLRDMGVFHYN